MDRETWGQMHKAGRMDAGLLLQRLSELPFEYECENGSCGAMFYAPKEAKPGMDCPLCGGDLLGTSRPRDDEATIFPDGNLEDA